MITSHHTCIQQCRLHNNNIFAFFQTFLQWFCAYQFDSMFPSASFTRRTTALSNLMLIKDIFRFEENGGMFRQLLLVRMINDSLKNLVVINLILTIKADSF